MALNCRFQLSVGKELQAEIIELVRWARSAMRGKDREPEDQPQESAPADS